MLKRLLIAAAAAAVLTGGAAAAAPVTAAAPTGVIEVHGPGPSYGSHRWRGPGRWHGKRKWHRGKKIGRSCEPIVRWRKVGHHFHRGWRPVVVGWDCGRRHHYRRYH